LVKSSLVVVKLLEITSTRSKSVCRGVPPSGSKTTKSGPKSQKILPYSPAVSVETKGICSVLHSELVVSCVDSGRSIQRYTVVAGVTPNVRSRLALVAHLVANADRLIVDTEREGFKR